ncbi:hypothetical protein ZIOFF_042448 [Zingiber officinale]|uniref:Reverse transcriptase Ty1/copia-type domain-containing protein n=1 Tax=Zingiber officinale TaxID=94328 RepID=A0A8J5G9H9_ZINOF|nr:hypothetical protein ZIOFF_042448 [Zingiber officinale]
MQQPTQVLFENDSERKPTLAVSTPENSLEDSSTVAEILSTAAEILPTAAEATDTAVQSLRHDLIFTGTDDAMFKEFKKSMMVEFEMSDLGMMHYFLGIEVVQSTNGILFLKRSMCKKF